MALVGGDSGEPLAACRLGNSRILGIWPVLPRRGGSTAGAGLEVGKLTGKWRKQGQDNIIISPIVSKKGDIIKTIIKKRGGRESWLTVQARAQGQIAVKGLKQRSL